MTDVTFNADPRNVGYFTRRQDELASTMRENGYIPGLLPSFDSSGTLISLAFLRRYSTGVGRFLPLQEVVGELHYAHYENGTFTERNPWELDVFGEANLVGLFKFSRELSSRYDVSIELVLKRTKPKLSLDF